MKVVIIGLGLIGGSFAKDLKRLRPDTKIYGFDANSEHLAKALSIGLIEAEIDYEGLSDADMVFVAIPVDVVVQELPKILDVVGEDTLVFDAGSTKDRICKSVENHPKRRNFLAAHPIAGTEFSGPESAIENLYKGKTNIICEVEKTAFKLQESALQLFQEMGMRIRYMNAAAHDKHIAYVSHLSHISSFMLGKTVSYVDTNF